MATRELSLFADLDQGRLVQSFVSTLQATLPRFVFNDSVPISFRALRSNGNNSSAPWSQVDLTGKTVKIAIGIPGSRPSSGTFTLTYGANTTSAISYAADGATIQTALNAIASITAAGGVVVTKSTGGVIRIVFNSVGTRTVFTAATEFLNPKSESVIKVETEGSVSVREVVAILLKASAAATATLDGAFPSPMEIETAYVRNGVTGNAAAKATGVLFVNPGSVDGDTVVIGSVTFTLKTVAVGENQVAIGVNDTELTDNFLAKINAHSTVEVAATRATTTTLNLESKEFGTVGNVTLYAESSALTFDSGAMTGGVDYLASVGMIMTAIFTDSPIDGTFSFELESEFSAAIPWDATASDLQAAIEEIPNVGSGKVAVSGTMPQFTISFDRSLGTLDMLLPESSNMKWPDGRKGSLVIDSAEMVELLDGASQITAKLEIEIVDDGDSTAWTPIQAECTVIADIIPN